jgi:hypothetical protein
MADAFVPYAPLNRLKPVADDLWIVDGPEIRMSWLGLKVPFATRMTVARLPDGALWVHSPIEPDDGLIAAIEALGPVAHLIAPNTLHYWWLPDWAERFPDAAVWLAPRLPEKAKRPLPPHRLLGSTPPPEWQGAFEQVVVSGDVLTEIDFFHRASRTAILTDLIENFEPARVRSRFWRWVIGWSGAADPDGKAPVDMRATFRRHRSEVRAAAETMIGWAPERVILAHGRWYDRDGAAELRRAFRWVL